MTSAREERRRNEHRHREERRRNEHRHRRVPALLVVPLVLLAGCAAPGGGAGTRNDVGRCAAVLPLASELVHGRGVLTVVRPVNRDDVNTISAEAGVAPAPKPASPQKPQAPKPPPTDSSEPPLPKACLVVYKGDYPAGSIPEATAPATSGQYALIVARVRHPSLIRALVVQKLPADTTPRPWWKIF